MTRTKAFYLSQAEGSLATAKRYNPNAIERYEWIVNQIRSEMTEEELQAYDNKGPTETEEEKKERLAKELAQMEMNKDSSSI